MTVEPHDPEPSDEDDAADVPTAFALWGTGLKHAETFAKAFQASLSYGTITAALASVEDLLELAGADHPVDSVRLVYFVGHGLLGSVSAYSKTQNVVTYADGMASAWGNSPGQLRWVVLDSCLTLRWADPPQPWDKGTFDLWRPAFQGMRVLLGWSTLAKVDEKAHIGRPKRFAERLCKDHETFWNAWEHASHEHEHEYGDCDQVPACLYPLTDAHLSSPFRDEWTHGPSDQIVADTLVWHGALLSFDEPKP